MILLAKDAPEVPGQMAGGNGLQGGGQDRLIPAPVAFRLVGGMGSSNALSGPE